MSDVAPWVVVLICILAAWTDSIAAILNRVLQHVPTSIIITYHSVVGLVLVGSYILIEAAITGNGFRFTEYTGRQYGIIIAAVLCDSLTLITHTIAF